MTTRTLNGFRFVQIRQDDTLQQIAARELSNASRWVELVAINGLTAPFVTGDPDLASASVKLYGETLIVPAARQQASSSDPSLLFKTDILLTDGLITAAPNGDIATATGLQNLVQAIDNRLMTPLGQLIRHLAYGCGVNRIKGKIVGPTAGAFGARYVKDALKNEKRLASVGTATATLAGDRTDIAVSVVPIHGPPVSVNSTQV